MPSRDLWIYLLSLALLVCVMAWMRFDAAAVVTWDGQAVFRDEATLHRLRELGARTAATGHLTWPMDVVLWACESAAGSTEFRAPRTGVLFAGPVLAVVLCLVWALLASPLLGGRWWGLLAAGLFGMAAPVVLETAAGVGSHGGLTTLLTGAATLLFFLGLRESEVGGDEGGPRRSQIVRRGRRRMGAAGLLGAAALWAGAEAVVVLGLWAAFAVVHVTVASLGVRRSIVALHFAWSVPALVVVLAARFIEVDPGQRLAWDEVSWLHVWALAGLVSFLCMVPVCARLPMRPPWAAPVVAALVVGHVVGLGPMEFAAVRDAFREQARDALASFSWARSQVPAMQPPATVGLRWTAGVGTGWTLLLSLMPGRLGWFGLRGMGASRWAVPVLAWSLWGASWLLSSLQSFALVPTVVMVVAVLRGWHARGGIRGVVIVGGIALVTLWFSRPVTPTGPTPVERARAAAVRGIAKVFAAEIAAEIGEGTASAVEPQVLAPWELGSALFFEARVPVVGVGSHRVLADIQDSWRAYASPSLAAAGPLLDKHRVRFLVSVARLDLLRQVGAAMPPRSLWWSLLAGTVDPKRLEVVYASAEQVTLPLPGSSVRVPVYRVYRRVLPGPR